MSKPAKLARNAAAHGGAQPGKQEIDKLVALFNQGRFTDGEAVAKALTGRFPHHGFGWKVLGAMLQSQGRSAEALEPMRRAAALLPRDDRVQSNLGVALGDLNRLPESEACHRRALAINPNSIAAHDNLGNTLQKQGRFAEAETSYRRALALKPDYAEAHNNLGVTLMEQGRFAEAEACCRQALEIKPIFAEACNNLGIVLREQDRLAEAEASFRQALGIKPDYVGALNNLAHLLMIRGEAMAALNTIIRSLQTEERLETWILFAQCVKRMRFTHADDSVRDALIRALSEPWCRPTDLAQAAADIVKLDRNIGACMARAGKAWPRRLAAQDLFNPADLAAVTGDALLRCLLISAPACSVELERFLTMARHTMLDAATEETIAGDVEEGVLGFYSTLAQQCFINEYLFDRTDDEADRARSLQDLLIAALQAGTQVPSIWPVAVAAYYPLHSLPFADRLLARPWPEAVSDVLVQQVREPMEERQYRATISRLTTIEDEVSLLVQNQYEDNPYPRWIKTERTGKPGTVVETLRRRFPLIPFRTSVNDDAPDILIAGCGTGLHSIGSARRFTGVRVLAVDLSLGSLCYARRKTQELGLSMIEHAQADILKLGSLGRSFDVIESAGVLHHLADPLAGWQILLSLLRPGGFMRLGFYSEVARRDVVRARAFIAERGYGSTDADIRRCRQDLMNLDDGAGFGFAVSSGDFFSTSACRDLLFHVQERRMTLPVIEAFLRGHALLFLGFEIDAHVLQAYRLRFPDDPAATNLGHWHAFERENPDTFLGMYQFWIQKPLPCTQAATSGHHPT